MDKKKKYMWSITTEDYLEVIKLAQKNGKKPGDSIEKELFEVMSKKGKKPLGTTDMDIDLLTGELREKGFNVLNIKEEERKRERRNNNES